MSKRFTSGLVAAGLAVGAAVATAPMASADTRYSCTATEPFKPTLHAYATRINYGGNRSAIVLSGDRHVVQSLPLSPDPTWDFHMATGGGLQSRYSIPTQWGSPSNPLNLSTRTIRVEWSGHTNNVRTAPRYCYLHIGV